MEIYGRLTVNSFALRVDNKGEEENIGTGVGVGEGSDTGCFIFPARSTDDRARLP